MKTLIIHLSDIHMDLQWDYNDTVSQIVSQIKNYEADKYILVISGDLTNSGEKEQYNRIDEFLALFKSQLPEKDFDFVFAPGNHDIKYSNDETRDIDVISSLTDLNYFESLEEEKNKFLNYYEFCTKYNLPNKPLIDGNNVPYIDINIGKTDIRFHLINNAVFTPYKDRLKRNARGLIKIPGNVIDSMCLNEKKINVLVMHFPIFYLCEETYNYLKEKMNFFTYILSGHVHDDEVIEVRGSNVSYTCPSSISPALFGNKNAKIGLSFLLIDDSERKIRRYSFFADKAHNRILPKDNYVETNIKLLVGNNPLCKKDCFCDKLIYQDLDGMSLFDSFIFPELQIESQTQNDRIKTFDSLRERMAAKGVLLINGSHESGKSFLLNKMFFDFDLIGITVYLDFSDGNRITEENVEGTIKAALANEYEEDRYVWNTFISTNTKERIVLIDNASLEESLIKSIEILKGYFGVIIVAYNDIFLFDRTPQGIALNNSIKDIGLVVSIKPMFKQKRWELIEKRYSSLLKAHKRSFTDDDIKLFVNKVESVLNNYVGNDSNYPYFINKLVSSMFNNTINLSEQNNKIYTKIYESYISQVLSKVFPNQEEYLLGYRILEMSAYYILRKRKLSVEEIEISSIITEDFRAKRIKSFSPSHFIDLLVKHKIFVSYGSELSFGSFDFLAFFAATYYSELLNEDFEKNVAIIDELLEECNGITNSKFLLFLACLSNKRTMLYLIEKAEKYVSEFEDFEVTSELYTLKDKEFSDLQPLSKKDRQTIRERIHEKESQIHDKAERKYEIEVLEGKREIDDKEIKRFNKGVDLLDIISSLLPETKTVLGYADQDRCISIIYRLPTILYRYSTSIITDNFDLFVEKFREYAASNGKSITVSTAERIVIDYCRATFLAVVSHGVSKAHTRLTSEDLSNKSFVNNETKKLIRLMSTMYDDEAANTFEKISVEYFNYFTNSAFARNCISIMVRNYISWFLPEQKTREKARFLRVFFKDEKYIGTLLKANMTEK